ncbi:MAG: hypothetical protein A3J97_11670 [Spirochaetes bacterium RIFOXYC1_FULL_54_7]|nr:MAG: hypothetical protein A3J97_11670 [Spirochaetes bacterium RIFOXYC1_FULL_54_7]
MSLCNSVFSRGSAVALSGVLPRFVHEPRFLTLLLTFILFMAFPLPACAAPSERTVDGPAPGKASQPCSIPLSKPGSMTTGKPTGGYDMPSWADLTILSDEEPGTVLMVVAGVHGDETSGPMAARKLAAGPAPVRGILFVLPVASPEALAAGQRWLPGWSDLNRAFPVAGESGVSGTSRSAGTAGTAGATRTAGTSRSAGTAGATGTPGSAYAVSDPTYQRADEILALIASVRPALLLDLHESDHYWTEGDEPALVVPASAGSVGSAGSVQSAELALELMELPGMEGFAFTGPPPAGSLVAAVAGLLGIPALLVEVPDALVVDARIAVYLAVVEAAMRILGMGCQGTGDVENPVGSPQGADPGAGAAP